MAREPADGVSLLVGDHPAVAVHDRLRGARAQDARPRPPGGLRAPARGPGGRPRPDPAPARGAPHRHHPRDRRACSAPRSASEARITADELRLIVERGGEQGILEAEEEQMINAVIELGGRRDPRGHGPAHRDRRAAGVGHASTRRSTRSSRRATRACPSTSPRWTRSSASSTRRTSCRSSSPTPPSGRPADPAADPGLRAGVDVHRRPAPRVPAAQGPPRHRDGRVRRARRAWSRSRTSSRRSSARSRTSTTRRSRSSSSSTRTASGWTAARRSTTCWTSGT